MSVIGENNVEFFKPLKVSGLELFTCSDNTCSFAPHFNDVYCIWLDTLNAEKYVHKGSTHVLQPNEFGIISPGEVHSNSEVKTGDRYLITFYLEHEELQKVAQQMDEKASEVTFITSGHTDLVSVSRLLSLKTAIQNSSSTLETQSIFLETISHIIMNYGTEKVRQSSFSGEERRVNSIIEIFNSYIAEDISLDFIAETVKCTPFHLIRFFKKSVGLSPHAYLVQLRLEKARKMIKQGKSIIDTSLDTGFADQSHLTRAFKAKFGLTPGRYQRLISA